MSTIGYESWAVDLAEVGAIYPFQGSEVLMVIIAVVFWLVFHAWQIKHENAELEAEAQAAEAETSKQSIDRY